MAGSVNKVILVGALGRDPEARTTQSGALIVNLSVATSESWKDKSTGERKEKTEWHRVVIFNENLAKVAQQYLHKGNKVYLEGKLCTRKFTDKDGIEKFSTEIVLENYRGELVLLSPQQQGQQNGGQSQGGQSQQRQAQPQQQGFGGGLDDDIPF